MKKAFPWKNGDAVSFPDTESEFVDVGFGVNNGMGMKVAEMTYENIVIVRKWGRGFRLECPYGSEIFNKSFNWGKKSNRKKYISLKEYLDYFGNYSELKYVCTEEELDPTEEMYEQWEKESKEIL